MYFMYDSCTTYVIMYVIYENIKLLLYIYML